MKPMLHDKTPPSTDIAKLQARLDFVESQYKSLQLSMKYQREAFLKNTADPLLLKLAPRRYRSLDKLRRIASLPFGWTSVLWRHPLKFSLWWTARKLQARDVTSNGVQNSTHAQEIGQNIDNILAGKTYYHIFFMPFISRGGGEKYMLNIIDELCHQNPLEPVLMIVDTNYTGPTWEERLPIGVDYIDLAVLCQHMTLDKRYEQAFHLAQAASGEDAQWHFQPSESFTSFSRRHRQELKKRQVIFYHFCNYIRLKGNKIHISDKIYENIARNIDVITKIVSDNQSILDEGRRFLEKRGRDAAQKFTCLYTKTDILQPVGDMSHDVPLPLPRIFWASRLDEHKRPNLLFTIGEKMCDALPDQIVDVYGYSVFDYNFEHDKLPPSVKFHGAFNGLSSLGINPCDILIYTSHMDGLPNVILEAISLGAVVIAPDVGGIGEIVKNNETGILLPNIADDGMMADLYINSLKILLADDDLRLKLAQKAQKRLQQNHAGDIFTKNIRNIFDVHHTAKRESFEPPRVF